MNLVKSLLFDNKQFDNHTAFIEGSKTYSYKEMKDQVRYMRYVLYDIGVEEGKQVILLEPISIRFYILLLAVWSFRCVSHHF